MKKIIFTLSLIIVSFVSFSQTCPYTTPGNMGLLRACRFEIISSSSGYFTCVPPAIFSNSITAPNIIGSWNGQPNILAACNSIGIAPSGLVARSDSNITYPSFNTFKDSNSIHRAFINTKISITQANLTFQPIGNYRTISTSYSKIQIDSIQSLNVTALSGKQPTGLYLIAGDLIPYSTKVVADGLYKAIGYSPTKTDVGLSNVDNTDDLSKPISTATQTALNGKQASGSYITAEIDGSTTNEIQTLSRLNGTISLSNGGGSVHIPDSSAVNEIELPVQTGNSGKFLVTDGTNPSWTIVKKRDSYSGTTTGSGGTLGTYAVIYSTAYGSEPTVIPYIKGGTPAQNVLLTTSTNTGFTVTAYELTSIVGLVPSYTKTNGLIINVAVLER